MKTRTFITLFISIAGILLTGCSDNIEESISAEEYLYNASENERMWKEKVVEVANSTDEFTRTREDKAFEISMYGGSDYDATIEEVEKFSMDIVDEYKNTNGKYEELGHIYALEYIFKASVVHDHYMGTLQDSESDARKMERFSFEYLYNLIEQYEGKTGLEKAYEEL